MERSREPDWEGRPSAGILYTSKETHYSVMKAARMYRMDAIEVCSRGSQCYLTLENPNKSSRREGDSPVGWPLRR